jgi:hypothetical protein
VLDTWKKVIMEVLYIVIGALSFLIVFWFSILAGRAETRMWQKVRVKTNDLQMQQQITRGRSHLR